MKFHLKCLTLRALRILLSWLRQTDDPYIRTQSDLSFNILYHILNHMYIILSLQMFYNKLNIVYLGLQDQCANVILNVKAVVVLVQVNFFHTDTFLE